MPITRGSSTGFGGSSPWQTQAYIAALATRVRKLLTEQVTAHRVNRHEELGRDGEVAHT